MWGDRQLQGKKDAIQTPDAYHPSYDYRHGLTKHTYKTAAEMTFADPQYTSP